MAVYRKAPHWQQRTNDYTCGPVCLRMVLSHLEGRPLTNKEYQRLVKLTMDGNPRYEKGTFRRRMKSVVTSLGYAYDLIKGKKRLNKALKLGPVIVYCDTEDDDGEIYRHYIVITDKTAEYYLINDPCKSKPGKILQKAFLGKRGKLHWRESQWGIRVFKA